MKMKLMVVMGLLIGSYINADFPQNNLTRMIYEYINTGNPKLNHIRGRIYHGEMGSIEIMESFEKGSRFINMVKDNSLEKYNRAKSADDMFARFLKKR